MLRDTANRCADDHLACGVPDPAGPGVPAGAMDHAGFAPDTMVKTETGPRKAGSIRAGDRVLGFDGGFHPVLWAGRYRQSCMHGGVDRPVRIAWQKVQTRCRTILAPGQRVALTDPRHDLLFGTETVLCPARDLVHLPDVATVNRHQVTWVSILLDRAMPIRADGMWLESLVPDMAFLGQYEPDMAAAIRAAVPGLHFAAGRAAYLPPFPVLNAHEASLIASLYGSADHAAQSATVSRSNTA